MILLIDIGNSRIKWAILENGALHGADAIEHHGDTTVVDAMFERISLTPMSVVAANVAGDLFGTRVVESVREHWGLSVLFATTQPQAGPVRNGYKDFRQLGVDRWLAIIAAVERCAGSVCIVDAGTAVTIDVVAADGAHLGGYIIPGLDLMRQSLGQQTGDLRRLGGDEFRQLPQGWPAPGESTAEAINGGALAAVCCLIDRCVDLLRERGEIPTLVVTGGDAQRLIRHLDAPAHYQPQLVLEGLKLYEFEESAERKEC